MKQPGDRLGPYEIVEPIGKGAMAEVYKARDVRLQREVALKVLSGTAGADPAFLGRFEREARSASAIDHPNVVTVHDVGRVESTAWIALELVDGRTLREILAHERLPLRRALSLAAQIADGLAAAHDRGIVHRDLKPENIKVTHDGLVKILDFGLAKVQEGLAALSIENNPTTPGVLIGTVLYMSPEQADCKPVDFRSDQFSFASVLFEMVTGQAPFLRNTVATTLFAIGREDPPPLPELDPAIRMPLRWILDRCLAKEAESRYASTRDLARDLHRLSEELEHPAAAALEAPAPAPGRRARTIAVPLVAPLALLLGFLTGDRCHKPGELVFQQLTYGRGHVVSARFMPDGLTVMYSAGWEGNPFTVYRKDPQSFESLTLDVPPGWLQAVSPKGTLMLVTSPQIRLPGRPLGLLAETPYAGGLPRPVLENVQFADWDRDGNDMAVVVHRGGETVLEFPRGKKAVATTPGWITAPRVSPSGELVAFVDHPNRGDDRGYVAVVDRAGRQRLRTQLWSVARGLAWSPDGSEVWFAASPGLELSALRAVGLDGTVRMLARAPGPLALLDVSPNGDALVARETRHFCIAASLPDGSTQELSYLDSSLLADLSDDGRTMLFTEFGESGGMFHSTFLRDLGSARPVRLGDGFARALSPDSSWALSLILKEIPDLMLLPTRAGEPLRLNYGDVHYHAADFLPGGRGLLVAAGELAKGVRLYVQDLDGSAPRPVTDEVISSDHYQGFPASPDGRWVATVEEDGIALRAVDHPEKRMLAGLSPGTLPIRWTSDGGALYVFRPDEVPARILRVDALTGRASPWRTIAPPDRTGVHIFPVVRLSADGGTCVYSYARYLTVLYRVKGLH